MESNDRTRNLSQENADLYELDPAFGQTMAMPGSAQSAGNLAKTTISAETTAPMAPIDPAAQDDEQLMYEALGYGQEEPPRKGKLPLAIGIVVAVAVLAVAAVAFLLPGLTSGGNSSQAASSSGSAADASSSAESTAAAASSGAAAAEAPSPAASDSDAQAEAAAQTGGTDNGYAWQGGATQNRRYYNEPGYDAGGEYAEPEQGAYTPDPGDDIGDDIGGDAGADSGGDAGGDAGADSGADAGADSGSGDSGADSGGEGGGDAI